MGQRKFADLDFDHKFPNGCRAHPAFRSGVLEQVPHLGAKPLPSIDREQESVRVQKQLHLGASGSSGGKMSPPKYSSISASVSGSSQPSGSSKVPRALPSTGFFTSIGARRTSGFPALAIVTSSPASAR